MIVCQSSAILRSLSLLPPNSWTIHVPPPRPFSSSSAFLISGSILSRKAATLITVGLLALIGSTAALSSSTLANFKPFGLNMFDLFDFVTSNILLPVGGIAITVFVGWFWGFDKVQKALTNEGVLKNQGVIKAFFTVTKFVSPVLITIVLLRGLGII